MRCIKRGGNNCSSEKRRGTAEDDNNTHRETKIDTTYNNTNEVDYFSFIAEYVVQAKRSVESVMDGYEPLKQMKEPRKKPFPDTYKDMKTEEQGNQGQGTGNGRGNAVGASPSVYGGITAPSGYTGGAGTSVYGGSSGPSG